MKILPLVFAGLLALPCAAQDDDDEEEPRRRRSRSTESSEPAERTERRRSERREAPSSVSSSISPQGRQFGLGLQVGAPTALTIKYMVAPDQGLVAGLGVGIGWDPSISLHVDYLWHPSILASLGWGTLSWYVGGGGWLSLSDDRGWGGAWLGYGYARSPFALGARLPLGVDLAFSSVPIELYLEADPTLIIFPRLGLGIGATLGGRFYF